MQTVPDKKEKKRTTANRQDDVHKPGMLPNQCSENTGCQGRNCSLYWALPTTAMAANQGEDYSNSEDTAGNASPSLHLLPSPPYLSLSLQ